MVGKIMEQSKKKNPLQRLRIRKLVRSLRKKSKQRLRPLKFLPKRKKHLWKKLLMSKMRSQRLLKNQLKIKNQVSLQ